jgi:hypothetical protein
MVANLPLSFSVSIILRPCLVNLSLNSWSRVVLGTGEMCGSLFRRGPKSKPSEHLLVEWKGILVVNIDEFGTPLYYRSRQ